MYIHQSKTMARKTTNHYKAQEKYCFASAQMNAFFSAIGYVSPPPTWNI